MKAILVVLFVVFVLLYSALSWGYVGHTMYMWFVLPHFPTFPVFSVTQFIGFILFSNVFITRGSTHIKEEYKDNVSIYTSVIFGPWMALIGAWILKSILM